MKLLNLDEITSEDKQIQIGNEVYIIPGDLPVETMFRIMDNSSKVKDDPNNTQLFIDGVDALIDVFRIRQPEIDIDKIKKNLTMSRYAKLTSFIFDVPEGAVEKKSQESESGNTQ